MNAVLDVSDVIDRAPIGRLQRRIFVLCTACMIMDGFNTQALGYVAPAIISEWLINPSLLGPVFGATNLGVLVGQLSFTMLGDKIGRRPVLIAGTVASAVLTLMIARTHSIAQLLVIRLVGGMALGSIIPNGMALVGEYCPRRVRIRWMTWTSIGFTAGAALCGLTTASIIPTLGWRGVFYLGGGIPLALAVLMLGGLPESLPLLVLQAKKRDYVARWLKRIEPAAPVTETTVFSMPEEHKRGVPVVHLLRDGRGAATLLLWIVNFMNLFNLYSLSNWLPTVVTGAGYSTSTAVLVGTVLQVGGTISAFVLTYLTGRAGFIPVLTSAFAIASISVAAIGHPGLSFVMLIAVVFIAGGTVIGSQSPLNALAAVYYPTYLRSTGVGWALGIGRAGSIVGPVLAGEFIALKWTTEDIFYALAVPAVISAIAMFSLRGFMKAPGA